MKIKFLNADQVVWMHDVLVKKYGGSEGGGHRGNLYEGVEAAVQAVKNSYYDDAHELAASYAVYIVQGHVFQDGNKRSGQAAMETFLEANGLRLSLTNDEVKVLMVDLQAEAERGARTDALIAWLAGRLRG